MSKLFIKPIAVAGTIILTLLGETRTSWGMWQQQLDEMPREEAAKIKARHEYHHMNSARYTMDSNTERFKAIFVSSSDRVAHLQDVKSCSACKSTVELFYNEKEHVLQEIPLIVQEMNERLTNLERNKLNAQKNVQNRLIVLEDIAKDIQKVNQVEVLEQQLENQKKEIKSLLLANQEIQDRVQKLEQQEEQKRIRKEAKEQFKREQEENIRSLSVKENDNYTWKIIRKTIGYSGAAIGIGLLSWYSYSGI